MEGLALAKLIHRTRFRFMEERQLQDQIEQLLQGNRVPYLREMPLTPKDRIDFLCGTVGIEVKIEGAVNAVQRQLWRYAADNRISELILVTTRSAHKSLPPVITGKPVMVVHLVHSIF